ELENGEGLLAKSVPGRSHRHASASASFEHSWQLLEPDEQAAVSALAVFAGSFSRQAAEAVAGVSLELLKRLIDVSLLRPIADDRYDFQPLVRSQAAAKLAERAEVEAQLLKDLREYFRGSVEELRASLGSRRFGATAAALDADLDNLRLAWRTETDQDALYDYAVCLASYLERRGLWVDQLELGRRALERRGDPAATATACFTAATVRLH